MGTVHLLHFLWFTSKDFTIGRRGWWVWSAGGPWTMRGSSHCVWTSHLSLPLPGLPQFLSIETVMAWHFAGSVFHLHLSVPCTEKVHRHFHKTLTSPFLQTETFKAFQSAIRSVPLTDQSNNLILLPPSRHQSTVLSVFFCCMCEHDLGFFASLYRGDLMNYFCCIQQWLPHGMFSLIDYLRNSVRLYTEPFYTGSWDGTIGKPLWVNLFLIFPFEKLCEGNMPWRVHIAAGMFMCGNLLLFYEIVGSFIALLSECKIDLKFVLHLAGIKVVTERRLTLFFSILRGLFVCQSLMR